MSESQSQLLTISEMGNLFHVSTRTVQRWSERNVIPFYRIGRTMRYDIGKVYRHLNEQTGRTPEQKLDESYQ